LELESVVTGDLKAQTERVLQNIKIILDAQGLTFAILLKSTVFPTDLEDFVQMNDVYAKHFTENYPARSAVQVSGLPKGAKVEIEVVAHF
jgi:2-iminobutanoate/2-iminopropanoate deaminase